MEEYNILLEKIDIAKYNIDKYKCEIENLQNINEQYKYAVGMSFALILAGGVIIITPLYANSFISAMSAITSLGVILILDGTFAIYSVIKGNEQNQKIHYEIEDKKAQIKINREKLIKYKKQLEEYNKEYTVDNFESEKEETLVKKLIIKRN